MEGGFSVKEPTLVPYRALTRHLLSTFKETEIGHMPYLSNQYADALATLGSSLVFDENSTSISVLKRNAPLTKALLKEDCEIDDKDWRHPILVALSVKSNSLNFKVLKDYYVLAGILYKRL